MNKNGWDHNAERDAAEGPEDCVHRGGASVK